MSGTRHRALAAGLSARRRWVDRMTRHLVTLGGVGVVGSVVVLFGYLLSVVWPLFEPASIGAAQQFQVSAGTSRMLAFDGSGEHLVRITAAGSIDTIRVSDGAQQRSDVRLDQVLGAQPVAGDASLFALRQADNRVRFGGLEDRAGAAPRWRSRFRDAAVPLAPGLLDLDVALEGDELFVAQLHAAGLRLLRYRGAEARFPLEAPEQVAIALAPGKTWVRLGPRGRSLWVLGPDSAVTHFDLGRFGQPVRQDFDLALPAGVSLQAVEFLSGRASMLLARSDGVIEQRFLQPGPSRARLARVRQFRSDTPLATLISESRRKGFLAIDAQGGLRLGHATTGQWLTDPRQVAGLATRREALALSPRAGHLASIEPGGRLTLVALHNRHPEVSFDALWAAIWYEGYPEPVQSWQSSAADDDFEPKLSLAPLMFGTLKAALFAMCFAVPIAVMGALYTACFMSAAQRAVVKPAIEVMAALPTVVLGFVAGIWLAPVVEQNLSSVLSLLVLLPLGLGLCAVAWQWLASPWANALRGSYGLLTIAPIALIAAGAFTLGPVLERSLFAGNSAAWLENWLGLEFDQRNALVVGVAMGFAIIPVIYSIAEDAIYGVPAHLANGALALGASQWQTALQVILPTASPGVFSAVIIGFGRAAGETMIVLMATGNTPIMDWNLFEGMRTLAANIAVELPEAEVDSSHYRVLFLIALVLFLLTFAFNSLAEVIRSRLRARYGNL